MGINFILYIVVWIQYRKQKECNESEYYKSKDSAGWRYWGWSIIKSNLTHQTGGDFANPNDSSGSGLGAQVLPWSAFANQQIWQMTPSTGPSVGHIGVANPELITWLLWAWIIISIQQRGRSTIWPFGVTIGWARQPTMQCQIRQFGGDASAGP